jgi:Protein of unknown function (DUF1173)
MNAPRYLINGRIFAAHDLGLQAALARIYGTPARPRCLCVGEGVEMYVSKFTDFVIKRMPETGADHRPTCPSYELPASESGFGEVLGEAIIERGPDSVELRLDFPLTRRIGRSFATAHPKPPGEVTVARKTLSLRGLLHYLWQRAGTAKYSKNGHSNSPIKSSHFRGIGCPCLRTIYGQNECRMSIGFSPTNTM